MNFQYRILRRIDSLIGRLAVQNRTFEADGLDAVTFGKGYGEENDLCMRARARGWRHVLAADVYVHHVGGRSFGRRARALRWYELCRLMLGRELNVEPKETTRHLAEQRLGRQLRLLIDLHIHPQQGKRRARAHMDGERVVLPDHDLGTRNRQVRPRPAAARSSA